MTNVSQEIRQVTRHLSNYLRNPNPIEQERRMNRILSRFLHHRGSLRLRCVHTACSDAASHTILFFSNPYRLIPPQTYHPFASL